MESCSNQKSALMTALHTFSKEWILKNLKYQICFVEHFFGYYMIPYVLFHSFDEEKKSIQTLCYETQLSLGASHFH